MNPFDLNLRTQALCDDLASHAGRLRIKKVDCKSGASIFDFGVEAVGGIEAGLLLSKACMADLGEVVIVPGNDSLWPGPAIQVTTDHPVLACLASQYAGWEIKGENYFAMASGPMRAAAAREAIFEIIGIKDHASTSLGVLEASEVPPREVCEDIALKCGIIPDALTLLVAPTRSIAGTMQIVARSVETALHKLHEIGFDVSTILSGYGTAPLPPPAKDDMTAIGRTNDAILYGGEVTLYIRCEDAVIEKLGPLTPSCTSPDHGQPFAKLFADYNYDFYQVDKLLFSPAVITFVNLESGKSFRYGHTVPRVIHESFG